MPACSAYRCKNREKKDGISLHRFPKNPVLRQKWVDALHRQNFIPSSSAVLCSAHFKEEHMDRTSQSSVRVRENCVPTLFHLFPSYMQKAPKTRKLRKLRPSPQILVPDAPCIFIIEVSPSSATKSTVTNTSTPTSAVKSTSTPTSAVTSMSTPTSAVTSISTPTSAVTSTTPTSAVTSTSNPTSAVTNTSTPTSAVTSTSPAATTTPQSTFASTSVLDDSPRKSELERKLSSAKERLSTCRKKIKLLQQAKRRLIKKNTRLKNIISHLRKEDLMSADSLLVLDKPAGGVADLVKRQVNKKLGKPLSTSYSAEL